MAEKPSPPPTLIEAMDDAARELLKPATADTMGEAGSSEKSQPVDMKSRIAAFAAVTTYLAMRNKIRPEGAKPSGIQRYQSAINGGTPGHRASRKAPSASPLANAGDREEAGDN